MVKQKPNTKINSSNTNALRQATYELKETFNELYLLIKLIKSEE